MNKSEDKQGELTNNHESVFDENINIEAVFIWLSILFGIVLFLLGVSFVAVDDGLFITLIGIFLLVLSVSLLALLPLLLFLRKNKKYKLNKLASLIVASELRSITDIIRLSGISEKQVIDYLRILVSDSSPHKLGNDARYLKGAKINLQTMTITLSDKYVEKEPWICVYCRAVNEVAVLTCQSCHAPKKKL